MAARRILILFVVLMGIGVLASTLAPRGSGPGPTTVKTTPTQVETTAPTGATKLVIAKLTAPSQKRQGGRPPTVRVEEGDRVQLTVRARFDDQVVVTGYDLQEPVSDVVPGAFDFIADQPGHFAVRTLQRETLAGTLVVAPSESAADDPAPRR